MEFTINNNSDFIINKLFKEKADVIAFSCYIWNIEQTLYIINTLKKVAPHIKIVVGGPEVSFDANSIILENDIDFIVTGEGELPFSQLLSYFVGESDIQSVSGTVYKVDGKAVTNPPLPTLNLDDIPFAYEGDLEELQNRIIYYEASRGCPFNCSYCLSGSKASLRLLPLERVFSDLNFFIENNVKQVKFVDRTFNWNKEYCMEIWKYLIEHDNNVTNFHFEICAEILEDYHLELLKKARVGLFQFEIGVQSTNKETLKCIDRTTNLKQLFQRVKDLKELKNIHLHLDLIAGLPKEDYSSFLKSFDDVYHLFPEQLQLGFLKLLKGSKLRQESDAFSLVFREKAPYEVLYTDVLPFSDVLKLKDIENMVDIFYNSRKFVFTCIYIVNLFKSPVYFFENLSDYWEKNNYDYVQHTNSNLYFILYEFFLELFPKEVEPIKDILKFDMFYSNVIKSTPSWLQNNLSLDEIEKIKLVYRDENKMKMINPDISSKQANKVCQIEKFNFNIIKWINSDFKLLEKGDCFILFNYVNKKPVNADGFPYTEVL